MFSWFDLECNFSGLLELFAVHHSGGNRACWELVWLEYWKEFYFQEVKCFSSGHIDSFLIWNVSHTQHTFLDSDFHWDLQFHFKSPGDLFWVCVSFGVCSTAHILHWTDQVLQGILGLICSQCCCLACIYQTPLRQSEGRKRKSDLCSSFTGTSPKRVVMVSRQMHGENQCVPFVSCLSILSMIVQ